MTEREEVEQQLRLVFWALLDANGEVEWLRESIRRISDLHTEAAIRASLKELLDPMTYQQALKDERPASEAPFGIGGRNCYWCGDQGCTCGS